jgi:calcium-dependent protein kinase
VNADILKEVAIMAMLQHNPHTIKCYSCFETEHHFVLVLELCKGGELFDAIINGHPLTEKEAASIMKPIAFVVSECHELGVVHRCGS